MTLMLMNTLKQQYTAKWLGKVLKQIMFERYYNEGDETTDWGSAFPKRDDS